VRLGQRPLGPGIKFVARDLVAPASGRLEGSVNWVIIFNILHMEDRIILLCEAHRILRDGGTAAVIHWRYDVETPAGPPLGIRPKPEQCAGSAEWAGFRCPSVRESPTRR
jgi:hypothetical protein